MLIVSYCDHSRLHVPVEYKDIIEILLKGGADPNITDKVHFLKFSIHNLSVESLECYLCNLYP